MKEIKVYNMVMVTIDDSVLLFMFIMTIAPMIIAALLGIMFILYSLFTPARTFLKAKTKHLPVIAARTRDRKIDYHIADSYSQGIVTSKKYGCFIVDEDSVYSSKKGGASILPVNAEIGITLSPRILSMIEGLKRSGFSNIVEAEQYNLLWGICECGYEGVMDFDKDTDGKAILVDGQLILKCIHEVISDEKSAKEKEEKSSGKSAAGSVGPEIPTGAEPPS